MKNLKALVLAVIFGGMLSACGNAQHFPDQLQSESSGLTGQSSNSYMPQALQCSETENVLSNTGAISSDYRACRTGSTLGSIKLFSADQSAQSVCVFPASNGRVLVNNPNAPIASRFIVSCTSLPSSGTQVNFQNLNFDSVYVVKAADAQVFAYCVAYGNIQSCAAQSGLTVSYGKL